MNRLQILFIPLDRLFDPLLKIIRGLVTKLQTNLRDVRTAVANVTLALRTIDWLQVLLQQCTEHRIHLIEA